MPSSITRKGFSDYAIATTRHLFSPCCLPGLLFCFFHQWIIGVVQHALYLIRFQCGLTLVTSWLLCNESRPAVYFYSWRCCWPDQRLRAYFPLQPSKPPLLPWGCLTGHCPAHSASLTVACTYILASVPLFFLLILVLCFAWAFPWSEGARSTLKLRRVEQVLAETGLVKRMLRKERSKTSHSVSCPKLGLSHSPFIQTLPRRC